MHFGLFHVDPQETRLGAMQFQFSMSCFLILFLGIGGEMWDPQGLFTHTPKRTVAVVIFIQLPSNDSFLQVGDPVE